MSDSVILVDGRNFVFRHHYPNLGLATQDGNPTSVLHGCLTGLLSLSNRLPDIPIVFVWDGGGQTWRHKLLAPKAQPLEMKVASLNVGYGQPKVKVAKPEGYKAQREFNLNAKAKDDRRAAVEQIPEFIKLLNIIGVRNFRIVNLEGDDLIGIMATAILQRKIFEKVIIHSTDHDFYQLICPELAILKGIEKGSGKLLWARKEEIPLKYGIQVSEWVKYRAITGDKSDNIPNFIRGVGPVTAVKWLRLGLDPSLKSYQDLPYLAKMNLKDVKVAKTGIVDWPKVWDRLHRNYICSQILVDGKFGMLPEQLRISVEFLIGRLTKKDFLRRQFSEDSYRQLTEKLAYWELGELLGKKDDFKYLR